MFETGVGHLARTIPMGNGNPPLQRFTDVCLGFYRASAFVLVDAAFGLSFRPSVRILATLRHRVKTAEHIVAILTAPLRTNKINGNHAVTSPQRQLARPTRPRWGVAPLAFQLCPTETFAVVNCCLFS